MVTNSVSSLEITLSSPSSVKINEEFITTIDADSQETHDVKIFVHKSSDEKITADEYISEIDSDGWKNPWYYLKGIYPSKKSFKIKVISSDGEREICARLRKSGSDSFSTICFPITIEESDELPKSSNKETEIVSEKPEKYNKPEESEPAFEENPINLPKSIPIVEEPEEKLILSSPQIKEVKTKVFIERGFILHSFIGLLVLLLILLAFRRL